MNHNSRHPADLSVSFQNLRPASGLVDLHEVFDLADRTLDHWRDLGAECELMGLVRGRPVALQADVNHTEKLVFRLSLDDSECHLGIPHALSGTLARLEPDTDPVWLVVGRVDQRELALGLIENTPEMDNLWREILVHHVGGAH
jgi:hypothetical protein